MGHAPRPNKGRQAERRVFWYLKLASADDILCEVLQRFRQSWRAHLGPIRAIYTVHARASLGTLIPRADLDRE
jgi:hypothetical protein